MIEVLSKVCHDYGKNGCLTEPDDRYTMNFDDIGEPPLFFCASCGPPAHELDAVLVKMLNKPGGLERAKKALDYLEQSCDCTKHKKDLS